MLKIQKHNISLHILCYVQDLAGSLLLPFSQHIWNYSENLHEVQTNPTLISGLLSGLTLLLSP